MTTKSKYLLIGLVAGLLIAAALFGISKAVISAGTLLDRSTDGFEAEASPVAMGLDLVGCEEHVCVFSFPNGRLPSAGEYCYLALAAAKPPDGWIIKMVCP